MMDLDLSQAFASTPDPGDDEDVLILAVVVHKPNLDYAALTGAVGPALADALESAGVDLDADVTYVEISRDIASEGAKTGGHLRPPPPEG